ncbi:MAG: AAA family ATPase, partial [Eubacteriaceae bacterium]|nr:AAA family ATPase [Eubacteriaceae bacterium]
LKISIPKAFDANDYKQIRDDIVQTMQKKLVELIQGLDKEATEAGFIMQQVPGRFMFVPMFQGRPMSAEEYGKVSPEERKGIDEKLHHLQKRMEETFREGQITEKQGSKQIIELDRKIALNAASSLVGKLKEKYSQNPKILEYLEGTLKDVTDNHMIFKITGAASPQMPLSPEGGAELQMQGGAPMVNPYLPQSGVDPFTRYKVNLFVNNEMSKGAPVILESSPNYYNLFGKIEYKSNFMSMSTDFSMVKSGAIQRANGGYLILQAKDLLMDPLVWNSLKKAIQYKEAVVENIGEQYRFVPTITLRPEAIPLNVKIILIGTPIFYSIFTTDEDFQKLFKVKVDFDIEMSRIPDNIRQYVSFVSSLCQQGDLKHFTRTGLARIIEYGSRLAGDQTKLSTRFNEIKDIVYESSALAAAEGSEYVDGVHVKKAIDERKYRMNRLEEKIQEEILKGRIMIYTQGVEVGQINGLSVIGLSGYAFGMPSRITARTYMGRGGVIHIERETGMSGSIHSKGVITLVGYLGGKFAQEQPLGLTAQITFEQNYQGVEGDSASSAELYAILSSVAGVPLKQNLAVTGSVDQRGKIQPIGGATEKIEGFYDICKANGLTGDQGVIIPIQNIEDLMLKDEVLEAVKEKLFHVYSVKTVEEGIEILTGMPAGVAGEDGTYPEGSVFYLVDQKLKSYAKSFENNGDKDKENGDKSSEVDGAVH